MISKRGVGRKRAKRQGFSKGTRERIVRLGDERDDEKHAGVLV
jgi:hypothetical protein